MRLVLVTELSEEKYLIKIFAPSNLNFFTAYSINSYVPVSMFDELKIMMQCSLMPLKKMGVIVIFTVILVLEIKFLLSYNF